jgi:hypothetical protein
VVDPTALLPNSLEKVEAKSWFFWHAIKTVEHVTHMSTNNSFFIGLFLWINLDLNQEMDR